MASLDWNSGYSVDYDDGSSQYNATSNFLVYGAFKVREAPKATEESESDKGAAQLVARMTLAEHATSEDEAEV